MKHTWYLVKAVLLVTLLFIAVNQAVFPVLKAAIINSKFRVVIAGNASTYLDPGQRLTLFIGNSRIMGGIDPAVVMSGVDGKAGYNLAFNGLYLEDLQLILDAFIRSCDCRVEYVYANPAIFLREQQGIQEISALHRFLSAVDPGAMQMVWKKDPVYAVTMRLFPLLHFNNEFFLRALYYSLTGRNDQDRVIEYRFTLTREVQDRLAGMALDSDLDRESIEAFRQTLARSGIRLVLVQPPYHRAYIENVPGFAATNSEWKNAIAGISVDYLDHSELFMDQPELFADPVHLNRAGQQQYSQYLRGIIQAGIHRPDAEPE
ncbi:MAG: hypothetical protein BMS9Abin33_0422 [Gammaproteobacteria bacterium]|nr:MAG: hypothetical protein BMS9Abin33_0422 [Gammaproteobacteria bacterium]